MVLVLAFPVVALAAPPANDAPQNATELTVSPPDGELNTVVTDDATTYSGEPMTASDGTSGKCQANGTQIQGNPDGPGTQMVKTAWWTFTGTGGRVTVSSFFSDFDTLLSVYTFESDSLLHFVKCNDDISFSIGDLTSELFINTTAGKTYYVQVGGCDTCEYNGDPTLNHGTLGVYAWPAPANDKRAGATAVTLNQNVAQPTYGAQADGDSVVKCGARSYGDTVWYRFTLPGAGTATIDASGFDSVVSLYPGSSPTPSACAVSPSDGASSLSRHLAAGTYSVQVGGQISPGIAAWRGRLNFKVSFAADIIDKPPPPPPPPPADSDGDHEPDSTDCAPTDPKRSHLLPEIVGNKIDENCDGKAQDYPEVRASRGPLDYVAGARTKLRSLVINRIAKGDKVTITCRGKGCRKKKIVKKFSRSRAKVNFGKQVRVNHPGAGAVIEVRVTHAKRVGHAWRYTFRFFKGPKLKEDLCVRPGASKAKACP